MTQKRSETPDEILLRAMGGRVERPGESPRVVAECWTCLLPRMVYRSPKDSMERQFYGERVEHYFEAIPLELPAERAEKHRAAGHDVREVKP